MPCSQGYRCDWSDKLLGFECGGQQWVSEVAMPCGTIEQPNLNEIRFVRELLELVEARRRGPQLAPAPFG
jgi:L-galactono-1,4-lactone dehydrogenase